MTTPYLSPAFSKHREADREFLRRVDDRTGMSLFWLDLTEPLLNVISAQHILEVGADQGQHTRHVLAYCRTNHARLTIIEPFVSPALKECIAGASFITLHAARSQQVIAKLPHAPDAAILEGDLNYAAALADLESLERLSARHHNPFPLVIMSAVSWPYARRDMYYEPGRSQEQHPAKRSGLSPWQPGLTRGLINHPFANAVAEGSVHNGVLTAVDDFLRTRSHLRFFHLPINHGIGVVYAATSPVASYVTDNLEPPPALTRLLETTEIARLNAILRRLPAPLPRQSFGHLWQRWVRWIRTL